MYEKEKAARAL
jgi:hypothetical protein